MESLDMKRLGTILTSGLVLLALATPTVAAAPPEPPEDAMVLRAMPRLRTFFLIEEYRDNIVIVSNLEGGKWVCQVHYLETIKVPRLGWTIRLPAMDKVILPPK
jgi:hypothetical protein